MQNRINQIYKKTDNSSEFSLEYFKYLNEVLLNIDHQKIEKFINILEKLRNKKSTIFIAGNGGSATTASTMANEKQFLAASIIEKKLLNHLRCYL